MPKKDVCIVEAIKTAGSVCIAQTCNPYILVPPAVLHMLYTSQVPTS